MSDYEGISGFIPYVHQAIIFDDMSSKDRLSDNVLISLIDTENARDLRRAYGSTRVPPHTVKILACNNPDVYLNRPEQVTRRLLNCEIVNKLY